MELLLTTFASETSGNDGGILGALGVDVKLLVLQLLAFLVLLWFLGKFVYPILIRAIDKREQAIAESVKAANDAEVNAEKRQAEIEKLFAEARAEASSIVDTAHKEAANMVKEAEDKAKKRSEQIVADARAQLDQDVLKARKALRTEATELVALATEKIIREKVDAKKDASLIAEALKEYSKYGH